MKALRVTCRFVGVLMAAGVIVGCGSQPVSTPMPRSTWLSTLPNPSKPAGWISPAAKIRGQQLLYVSQYFFIISCCPEAWVFIYPEEGSHQSPIGAIDVGGLADGIYVDVGQNLYVANQLTVTVYPPGSITPSLTLSQGLARPLYPIVDGSGNVFVSNAQRYYQNGGTVVEYHRGSSTPYQILQTPGIEADGMGFDRQGNLYVAYRAYDGTGSIEEFAPGSTQGKILGMALDQPQGLIVDSAGNILVVETASTGALTPRIDVFAPGQQTPTAEIPIPNTPNQLALRRTEPRLFIAAEGGPVYETRYPFRGKHPRLYVKEELAPPVVNGVALSNGQRF